MQDEIAVNKNDEPHPFDVDYFLDHISEDKRDLAKVMFGLYLKNERVLLSGLKNRLHLGKSALYSLNNECGLIFYIKNTFTEETYEINLFTAAVINNFTEVVQLLLECGVNVNEANIVKKDNSPMGRYLGSSPLSLACEFGNPELVQLLLKNNADLLNVRLSGHSILMGIKSVEILKLVLQAAKEQDKLADLLNRYKNKHSTVFDEACIHGRIAVLKELLHIENFSEYCTIRSLLHHARMATWLFPTYSQDYEKICTMLKPLKIKNFPIVEFSATSSELKRALDSSAFAQAYSTLFKQKPDFIEADKNKEQAIQIAITQIYLLFSSVEHVIPYLNFLNKEFTRYHLEKNKGELPGLDPESYQFEMIDGLSYPIPNERFVGIHNRKSLPEFLILLLNKYHLAKNAYKWVGLIPVGVAKEMFAAGEFITEDPIGHTLFHGKLSHMLQYAIIVYAMEHGVIHRDYMANGKRANITMADILNTLGNHLKLREEVLDIRYPETISFSDPFRMNSIIMEKGEQLQCKFLADYLINSFCKGINKRFEACKNIYNLPINDMTLFSEQSKDFVIESFTDTPQSINYAKQRELNKKTEGASKNKSSFFYAEGEKYAVVHKEFNPYSQFSPNSFV